MNMGIFFVITLFFLLHLASSEVHTPKVQESNSKNDSGIRSPRHSFQTGHYHHREFNFKKAQAQQDMLKHKYSQQQKSDLESYKRRVPNSKIAKNLEDFLDRKRNEFTMNIPFVENDWIPISPSKNLPEKTGRQLQDISISKKESDLETEESQIVETRIKDREDAHEKYIYIQPSILKNNFGLDSKTAQDILQKAAPSKDTGYELNALEHLLDKNRNVQLKGLQTLLQQSGVYRQHETSNLDSMQETLESSVQEENEDAFSIAQKQATAYLQAQQEAIAKAQKQLEEEALAKISAHNNGHINIDPKELAKMQEEALSHLNLPQFAALVGDPGQVYYQHPKKKQGHEEHQIIQATTSPAYGGHFKEKQFVEEQKIVPSLKTDEVPLPDPSNNASNFKNHFYPASTPKSLSQIDNVPLHQNREQTFLNSVPRTVVQQQEFPSSSAHRVLVQHQEPQYQIVIASTSRPVLKHQYFPSSTPQTLLLHNQEQQHQIYFDSTPKSIPNYQYSPSSTSQTLLNQQEQQHQISLASTPKPIHKQLHFPSSTAQTLLDHNQDLHHQIYLASTPKPIFNQQQSFSLTDQSLFDQHPHHKFFIASTPKTIVQPKFYASAAPQIVLKQHEPHQAFLQHVQVPAHPIAVKNLPPITAPQFVVQHQRLPGLIPQVQIKQTRPEFLPQQHQQFVQKYVIQTPRPQIIAQEPQDVIYKHQSQTERINLPHVVIGSTPEPPRVILHKEAPTKLKEVAYSAEISHGQSNQPQQILHAAAPTQAFLQGHQISTVGYAPSYRSPVLQHGVSYLNIAQEPQFSHETNLPVLKKVPQQVVVTPVPHHLVHHSLKNNIENGDSFETKQTQLNYDDLHQYASNYAFGYKIADHEHGNDYGHEEKKDGKNTKGHYHVNLPDGRRQKVEYYVDDEGYHANVSYENIAQHEANFPHKK